MIKKSLLTIFFSTLCILAHAETNTEISKNIFDDALLLEIKNEATELNISTADQYIKESNNPKSRLNSFKKLIQNLIASTDILSSKEIFIEKNENDKFYYYNDKNISDVNVAALKYAEVLNNPIISQIIFEYLSWLEFSNNTNQCELIDRSLKLLGYTQLLDLKQLPGIEKNKNTLLFYRIYHAFSREITSNYYPCTQAILAQAGTEKDALGLTVPKNPDIAYSLAHVMRKYSQNNFALAFISGGGSGRYNANYYYAPYLKTDGTIKWTHLVDVYDKSLKNPFPTYTQFVIPNIGNKNISADSDFSDKNFVTQMTSTNSFKVLDEYRKRTAIWMGR